MKDRFLLNGGPRSLWRKPDLHRAHAADPFNVDGLGDREISENAPRPRQA
jgi:hypothetical protein